MGCYNMGTEVSRGLQFPTLTSSERFGRKSSNSLQFVLMYGKKSLYRVPTSRHMFTKRERFHQHVILKVSCSSEISPARVLDSGSSTVFLDESKILKNKGDEIKPCLNGKCVYLVGMMGSGKTTVGKVLAEALGYSFCDCDKLIEEAVGGGSVSNIFKLHGENFFRDNETEVLHKLSLMQQVIVSTGGGAVVRPINWRHMRKGISVWLDVPLEALAKRIAADGTGSRPLIPGETGDDFSTIVERLSTLFDERGEAYANADVTVSLENIAAKLGFADVCKLTPSVIAIEVLLQIEIFLKK